MPDQTPASSFRATIEKLSRGKWPRLIVLLAIFAVLFGAPIYKMKVAHQLRPGSVPDDKVLPFDTKASALSKDYVAVVGAWSEEKEPTSIKQRVAIDPSHRLVVRVFDLDGWVLDMLAGGRLTVDGDEKAQKAARAWANSKVAPARVAVRAAAEGRPVPKTTTTDKAMNEATVTKLKDAATAAKAALDAAQAPLAKAADPAQPLPDLKKLKDAVTAAEKAAADATEEWAKIKADEEAYTAYMALFNRVKKNLRPNLNGRALPKTTPANSANSRLTETWLENVGDRVDDMIFAPDLADPDIHKIFRDLAKGAGFQGPVTITVSYSPDKENEEGLQLPTKLSPSAVNYSQRPYVSFVPWWKFWWIIAYLGGIAATMVYLGWKTSLLRARDSRRRPDGQHQLSLTHTQLAIWFVVVLGSYFYLWVITGELDNTFSDTGLYLVGISIAAAFGSHAIQGLSAPSASLSVYNQAMSQRVGKSPEAILNAIECALTSTETEWRDAADKRDKATTSGTATTSQIKGLEEQASRLFETCEDLRRQRRYMVAAPPFRWLTDLLSENGEVTIHRFQMLSWTLGLAFIFCAKVFTELQMPTFPPQVLALMGISAGTYLGFRIPETQKIKETLADPTKLSPPEEKT